MSLPSSTLARGLAGGLVACLWSVAAHAQSTPVRLEIEGEPGCVERTVFESRLASRGVAVRSASSPASGAEEPVASVRVVKSENDAEGTLVLRRTAGTTTRVVHAPSCDEVVDALAFTLALALERPPEEPGEAPGPPAVATVGVPPAPPPIQVPVDADRARPLVVAKPSEPVRVELGAAIVGGGATGEVPDVGPSIGGWALVGIRTSSPWLAPAALLGPMLVLPTTTTNHGGLVTFALQAASLDLCPLRLGTADIAVRPCVRTVLGRSQVKSEGFPGARLEERFFSAAGLALDGELRVAGPLAIVASLGATAPFERTTYLMGDFRAFATPVVAVSAAAGAGVHFP